MKKTIALLMITLISSATADEKTIRIGMIGLDTSHVVAFTELSLIHI